MNGKAQIPHLNPCFSLHIKVLYHVPFTDSFSYFSHTDVVPVHPDTVDQWTHPPYSGFFDGNSSLSACTLCLNEFLNKVKIYGVEGPLTTKAD